MSRPKYLARFSFALGLFLLVAGCGGNDRPNTYPVRGTVTLNGQPVENATVNFHAQEGSRGSVGRTDALGRYELTTFSPGDGTLPGEYRVTIAKYEVPAGAVPDDPDPPEEGPRDGQSIVPENTLPPRYASAESSGLTATVTEGTNTLDFALQQ